jgi:signal transduction histidine kinase
MQERSQMIGARLSVDSRTGEGTTLRLDVRIA